MIKTDILKSDIGASTCQYSTNLSERRHIYVTMKNFCCELRAMNKIRAMNKMGQYMASLFRFETVHRLRLVSLNLEALNKRNEYLLRHSISLLFILNSLQLS